MGRVSWGGDKSEGARAPAGGTGRGKFCRGAGPIPAGKGVGLSAGPRPRRRPTGSRPLRGHSSAWLGAPAAGAEQGRSPAGSRGRHLRAGVKPGRALTWRESARAGGEAPSALGPAPARGSRGECPCGAESAGSRLPGELPLPMQQAAASAAGESPGQTFRRPPARFAGEPPSRYLTGHSGNIRRRSRPAPLHPSGAAETGCVADAFQWTLGLARPPRFLQPARPRTSRVGRWR